jgi:hypothetical protein
MDTDNLTAEVFAYYGRAMYYAQCVEKSIMHLLLIENFKLGITKTRYEELLQEKSELTFGQLKRELQNLEIFSEDEIKDLDRFHENRDFLVHSYWWDRAVEFHEASLQPKLLFELEEFYLNFEKLDKTLSERTNGFIKQFDINLNKIMDELIREGQTTPFDKFRKLAKNEVVIDIFGYREPDFGFLPIFELEDNTYWTVCEVGLSQFKYKIENDKTESIIKLSGLFPIQQFNPRPRISKPWNYELDLKKQGLKMIISKPDETGPFKWAIRK